MASRIYKKLTGKSGDVWLVPSNDKFAADHVYVSDSRIHQGFHGAVLTFRCENDELVSLRGPWHASAEALYADTGYDVRNTHSTKVVLSKGVEYGKGLNNTLIDIIYQDKEPEPGVFNRGIDMARERANELDMEIYYEVQTSGGSHRGWMKPERNEK